MNASCIIDYNSVSKGVKNSVKKKLTDSKLFRVDEDIAYAIEESDYQSVVDEINKSFKEDLVVPYKGNIFRITNPSSSLVQRYIDFFSEKFVPKPVVPPKPKFDKGQFQGMPEFNKLPYKSEKKTMTYAGVGSRETPKEILAEMASLAKELEELGYTLNTGDAQGADKAFRDNTNKKNVFAPKDATPTTMKIAEEIHPAWDKLNDFGRKLQARNTNQIFGANLKTPVDFVIAWTKDGLENYDMRSIESGGTGQAIDMASRKGIPVINLANPDWREKLDEVLSGTYKAVPIQKAIPVIPQNKVSGVESYGSLVTANTEVIKALGKNPHSIDMIEKGFRTRTTRSSSEMEKYNVKVGDIIKHVGKSADGTIKTIYSRITAIHPKGSEGWKGTWEKEGWRAKDVKVIDRFKDGAAAIEFEVVDKAGNKLIDTKTEDVFSWARFSENSYEVSSKGDKRFSALYAKLNDGRTIEEAYQLDVKGYREKGSDWKLGKGKAPIREITKEQQWEEYKGLWRQYLDENPELLQDLKKKAKGKVLTDRFATTDISQARALAELLSEKAKEEGLYFEYTGTLSKSQFDSLSNEEQRTIIDQQNNC